MNDGGEENPQHPAMESLERYAGKIKAALKMTDYRIELVIATHDEEMESDPTYTRTASVSFDPHGALRAEITVYPFFWTKTRAGQRETITHELLHVLVKPLVATFGHVLDAGYIPYGVRSVVDDSIAWQEEGLVDRLGRIVAPAMPLPDADAAGWKHGENV